MKNNHPHLAALDSAIDGSEKAYKWLEKFDYTFLIVFADACQAKPKALSWLRENRLEVFIRLAVIIKKIRDNKTFDYHKLHF